MNDTPKVVDQILAAYDAVNQQFVLNENTLGSTGIANLIQTFFGKALAIAAPAAPVYDAPNQVVRVTGQLKFCPPGTTYTLTYATQAVFAAMKSRDAQNPDAWMLGLTLQIDVSDWSFAGFFPALADLPLARLQLAPSDCFVALASHTYADASMTPPLDFCAGTSFGGAAQLGATFGSLSPFFPADQASHFLGSVTFGNSQAVDFDLAVSTPIASPVAGYEAAFFAQLCARASESAAAPPATTGFGPSPATGTVRLGVKAKTTSGRELVLWGLYDPSLSQMALGLGTEDHDAVSLTDLAGFLPSFVADGLRSAIPLSALQTITQTGKVFQLKNAGVTFDLGQFALSSLYTSLQIVPDAAGYGTVHIDLAVGSIVLNDITLDAGASYPFQSPSLVVTVTAKMDVLGAPLVATASTDGNLALTLAAGQKLLIAPVFSRFTGLPATSMPAFAFSDLGLSVNLSDHSMAMQGALEPVAFNWGREKITLSDMAADFSLQAKSEAGGPGPAYSGNISGTVQALGATAALTMAVDEHWTLHFALKNVKPSVLIEKLTGVTSIPYLPDTVIDLLDVTVTPATHAIEFTVVVKDVNLPANDPAVRFRAVTLHFQQTSAQNWTLSVDLAGSATLGAALAVDNFDLTLVYDQGLQQWTTSGGVKATLFDAHLELTASYHHGADGDSLTLGYRADIGVLQLGELSLRCSAFEFNLTRRSEDGSIQAGATAAGTLKLASFFDISGDLAIEASKAAQSITLTVTDGGSVAVPLASIANLRPGLSVELKQFSLAHSEKDGWSISSAATMLLTGMPDYLVHNKIVPSTPIGVTFSASRAGVALAVPGTITSLPCFAIPPLDIAGTEVDLNKYGTAALSLRDLHVALGKDIMLTAVLAVALPEKLNDVFGTDKDGKAVLSFFVKPPQTVDVKFGAGLRDGSPTIFFSLETLPFLPTLVQCEDDHWVLDLGDCGQLRAQTPEFSFTGSSFVFNGGLSGLRTLKIPLAPLKTFLSKVGATAIADVLPSQPIGLPDIHVLDSGGDFDPSALIQILDAVLPGQVAKPIDDALMTLGKYGDRLPGPFKRYLDFTMIDGVQWNISVSGSASVDIDIAIGDPSLPRDQRVPLQLIFPSMVGPMPALQGIRFYGFSFGVLMGGTLFSLRLDADFDQFDLASLAVDVLIPPDSGLPIARDFHRTVVIDRLWMPVIYQTGVPIPIPLFYDELGLEYLGIEDLELQAHVGFPQPQADFGAYLHLLLQFFNFFKDPKAPIKTKTVPACAKLHFFLSKCFIRLPSYLGGQIIGFDEDKFVDLSKTKLIAELLNAIKFVSLPRILQVLPEDLKSGTQAISLGPVGMTANWAITDEAQLATTLHKLAISNARYELLKSAQPQGATSTQALHVLFDGTCHVGQLAGLSASFLLLAKSSREFATSFELSGSLGAFDYQANGAVRVGQPKSLPVMLAGSNELTFAGLSVLGGDFQAGFAKDTVAVQGDFHLLPADFPFNMASQGPIGGTISGSGLAVDGAVVSTLGSLPLSSIAAHLSNDRFYFATNFLTNQLLLDVTANGSTYTLHGHARLPPSGVDVDVKIDGGAKTGALSITGELGGGLQFAIKSALPQPSGSLTVTVLGTSLAHGSARVTNGQFSLGGTINIFPAASPVQFGVSASGSLGPKGVYLSGGGGTKIRFGPISVFELNTSATISSAGLAIGSNVVLLGVGLGGRAGIGKFKNSLCFCGHYAGDVGVGWLSYHYNVYVAVGAGVKIASFSRPSGWPSWAQTERALGGSSNNVGTARSLPATLQLPDILDIVDNLQTNGISIGDDIKSFETIPGALQLAVAYGLSFSETVDATTGEVIRCIRIHETHLDDDVVRTFREEQKVARDAVKGLVFESCWHDAAFVSKSTSLVDAADAKVAAVAQTPTPRARPPRSKNP